MNAVAPITAESRPAKKKIRRNRRGVTFPVPDRWRELGITHAVVGAHKMRGPICLRWKRADKSLERIFAQLSDLYGSMITGIRVIRVNEGDQEVVYRPPIEE